jgi:SAM-dependent methyltransferase
VIEADSSVIELAAGTGEFSLACAPKAKDVVCSDISRNMLKIAKKKAKKRGIKNISFENYNIYEINVKDKTFDFVLAPQVLHLLDNPQKAASELRRICAKKVILPQCLLKEIGGWAKLKVSIWKIFGFAPKVDLNRDEYKEFLEKIGFENCEISYFESSMPMSVAVWNSGNTGGNVIVNGENNGMWKYESCDFENISLHDNFIDKIQADGNDVFLVFDEGFDVVKTHPLNNTGKSKHTTTSQIILRNTKFLKGIIHHWEWQTGRSEQEKIDLEWLLNTTCYIEVLDWFLNFKVEDGTGSLCANMYWQNSSKSEYLELEFSCSDVLFCWNDYSEDAWFEGWPERTS